jgi:outer membrane protein, multidrug efflux system
LHRSFLLPRLAPLLLLTGCLAVEMPDARLDVPGSFRAGAARDAAPVRPDWWRSFRSGELTRLADAAETSNLDIAAAMARIEQADAQARIAGAPLLPFVGASAEGGRNRGATAGRAGASGVSHGQNQYSLGLNTSYELDIWGKNRAALRSAEQSALATRYERDTVALTATSATAQLYFRILAARDRKRIANQNLASASRVLRLINERLTVGTATALDLAQQESVVANLRAAIPPLDQEIDQDIASLAVLIGRAPERVTVAGTGMSAVVLPQVAPGLPSSLLLRRPDIAFAEAQLASANASIEVARAALFPTIALTGSGGLQSLALGRFFDPSATFYSIAAGLTQTVFDNGRLQNEVSLQGARQQELLELYRKSVLTAFSEVERALVAVRQLAEQERLQRESLVSSRRAYELSEQRLQEGTVDIVTVLNTQQALFQAEDALTQVRLSRLLAAVALYQALGGGFVKPGPADARPRP